MVTKQRYRSVFLVLCRIWKNLSSTELRCFNQPSLKSHVCTWCHLLHVPFINLRVPSLSISMTTLRDIFFLITLACVKEKIDLHLHRLAKSLSPYSKRSSSNRSVCSRSRLSSLSKPQPFTSTAITGKMASAEYSIVQILETIEKMVKFGLDEEFIDKMKSKLSQTANGSLILSLGCL